MSHRVVYDAEAVEEFVLQVKGREDRKALLNAVDKLCALGEQLVPPHMKPLQGRDAAGLRELRPRQGRSDWRAIYMRVGDGYVVLGFGRHDEFDALVQRAQARSERHR